MNDKQKRLMKLLNELTTILDKENIKYSLGFGSLLGTVRHGGFIPWDDDVDVLIDHEGLEILFKKYPDKVFWTDNSKNFLPWSKWSNDKENDDDPVVIDLFPVIKTNIRNVNKTFSLKNKCKFISGFFKTQIPKRLYYLIIIKIFFFPFIFFIKKLSYKTYLRQLKIDNNEPHVYYIISPPFKKTYFKKHVLPVDPFNVELVKFQDTSFKCSKERNTLLLNWYGQKYMTPKKWLTNVKHYGFYHVK
ncbi:diacylglycerol cholinephosphotransferase Mf1 [Mycoplasma crocodyli]|uniref:Hypothetical LicD family phosphotransferase n=1 Tax=Mycoplasma crocodyli (strain ATCC 51981 / MP145) TaxID=512564 RepID=D5E6G5_MYCCM|nr:LicD family protein [Mycoplasma crocodyli]ADE19672.1 hypothetical LicD family phosphotransferase [Mycoplasma crocodyli MP145]